MIDCLMKRNSEIGQSKFESSSNDNDSCLARLLEEVIVRGKVMFYVDENR